jgi:signal transduction histidine kinase
LTQILILKLRDSQAPEPGYALMAQQIARMQLNIKRTIQDKEHSRRELNHAEELAKALRSEIESGLRPLSQRLWIKSVFAPPSTKVTGVVNAAISELKYPFFLTATLYGCANVINTTQSLGFSSGVIFGVSTFIVFCLFERLRLAAISKFPSGRRFLNYFYVFFVGMAVGLVPHFVFKYLKLDYSFAVAIFSAPSLPILIIAVAGIRLSLSDRESMFDILNRRISQSKLENLDSIIHGNAASYLHNSLQSELTALALQLDSLANNPDPERNRVVMEKLEALVSQSKSEDFKNFMETPEARLNRVVNSWDGIAEIDLNIDPLVWKDSSRSTIVVSLIQEAVANSVRSGRANRVHVVSEYSKDSIFVTVTDNGSAQVTTERRGIGSQWIDRIAISDWKLEETDKGRVLRVEI